MTSQAPETPAPIMVDRNTGPVWRTVSEKLQAKLFEKVQKSFNGEIEILPDVIFYKNEDKSSGLHLDLLSKYFQENVPNLGMSCTVSSYNLNDGSSIIFFGHNNARSSNRVEFTNFISEATGHVNERLLTVGATKLISANKL
jgi:hypothetical protein